MFNFVVLCLCLFYVLIVFSMHFFVCKCVLYYCHRVSTQLRLTNTSNTKISNKWTYWFSKISCFNRCGLHWCFLVPSTVCFWMGILSVLRNLWTLCGGVYLLWGLQGTAPCGRANSNDVSEKPFTS